MKKIGNVVLVFVALVVTSLASFAQPLNVVTTAGFSSGDDVVISSMDIVNDSSAIFSELISLESGNYYLSIMLINYDSKGEKNITPVFSLFINNGEDSTDVLNLSVINDTIIISFIEDTDYGVLLKRFSVSMDGTIVAEITRNVDYGTVSFLKTENVVYVEYLVSGEQYLEKMFPNGATVSSHYGDDKSFNHLLLWNDKVLAVGERILSPTERNRRIELFDFDLNYLSGIHFGAQEANEGTFQAIIEEDILYWSFSRDVSGNFIVHLGTYNLVTGEEVWPQGNTPMSNPGDDYFKVHYHNGRIYTACGDEIGVHNATTGVYENNCYINPVTNPECYAYSPEFISWKDRLFLSSLNWDPVNERNISSIVELNTDGSLKDVHYVTINGPEYDYKKVGIIGNENFLYLFGNEGSDTTSGFVVVLEAVATYTITFNVMDDEDWATEGAEIILVDIQDTLISDINGQATSMLAEGYHYVFKVNADGYQQFIGGITVSEEETVNIYLTATVAVDEYEGDIVSIYPNPITDFIKVEGDEGVTGENIKIYNNLGQIVLEIQNYDGTMIDVNSLPTGVFLLKVGNTSQKLIKQ